MSGRKGDGKDLSLCVCIWRGGSTSRVSGGGAVWSTETREAKKTRLTESHTRLPRCGEWLCGSGPVVSCPARTATENASGELVRRAETETAFPSSGSGRERAPATPAESIGASEARHPPRSRPRRRETPQMSSPGMPSRKCWRERWSLRHQTTAGLASASASSQFHRKGGKGTQEQDRREGESHVQIRSPKRLVLEPAVWKERGRRGATASRRTPAEPSRAAEATPPC